MPLPESSSPERSLVDRCQKKEETGWKELCRCYEAGLRRDIGRHLGSRAHDRELEDEILSRIWCKLVAADCAALTAFDAALGCLAAYLAELARQVLQDYHRDRRRKLAWEVALPRDKAACASPPLDSLAVGTAELLSLLSPRLREFCRYYLMKDPAASPSRTYSPSAIRKMKQRVLQVARSLISRE